MTAPYFYPRLIEPPLSQNYDDPALFRRDYDTWARTGGYDSYIPNLIGLQASVDELNTLVGSNTLTTVQVQLDQKANIADLGTMAYQNSNNISVTGGSLSGIGIVSGALSSSTMTGSTVSSSTLSNNTLTGLTQYQIYTTGQYGQVGALLLSNVSDNGNNGIAVTDLTSYTLSANSLQNSGDMIKIKAFGTYAPNAAIKRFTLEFGSTILYNSGNSAGNDISWSVTGEIIRVTQNSQKVMLSVMSSNETNVDIQSVYVAVSEDLSTNLTIKCTGEGPSADDVVQRGLILYWYRGQ